MRIEQRQCLLGILPGKLFLSIGQVSICKIVMGVGRIGVSQQVELEDLDRIFYVALALITRSDDVHTTSGHNCARGSLPRASSSCCLTCVAPPGICSRFRMDAAASVSAGAWPG